MATSEGRGAQVTRTDLQLNHRFHFALYERCGNPELVNLIELLWMRYGPLLSLLKTTPISCSGHRDHAEVIDAVREGDKDSAVKSLVADLEEAATQLPVRAHAGHPHSG
ncbi:FCD domain-containing protein [Mesorhizobium abyssinicae]|uniref:FCD domain-containing protein n=1 Tax=Mesorhizobium abyssinicae TaxID=1209958 RepID=UPI00339400F3